MDLTGYEHKPCSRSPNKNLIPKNIFNFDRLDEFNAIYQWAHKNLLECEPTPSGGFPNNYKVKRRSRFIVVLSPNKFEMVISCSQGDYRFLLQPAKPKDNKVSGQKACREIYRLADDLGISLKEYACGKDDGSLIKEGIDAPHIEVLNLAALNCTISHVYHIDFRSSYASRIIERYPKLRPLFEYIYLKRHEDDGFWKHVMTNAIGCFQSKFCVDYFSRRKTAPFQFSELSKVAINGTRKKVEDMVYNLMSQKMVPLMTNTDGVWYYSAKGPYHGEGEGDGLTQWHNDHNDCKMLIKSVGAYQYVEDGVCHTVVRGLTQLDKAKPDRSTWEFGEIKNMQRELKYTFVKGEGVKIIYG